MPSAPMQPMFLIDSFNNFDRLVTAPPLRSSAMYRSLEAVELVSVCGGSASHQVRTFSGFTAAGGYGRTSANPVCPANVRFRNQHFCRGTSTLGAKQPSYWLKETASR
jgi:hypothetical protein